ncbi:DUF2290 domain-containing protein [Catenovulum agarivorans]|uniref:DUF2290 domain-containing protein n=1 Tax=Catenovulum agarivorans TaxID=1172192 RepID=UPI00030A65DC|nr:DUF2290 domain-containing protein [Catenovulum agarivorans]
MSDFEKSIFRAIDLADSLEILFQAGSSSSLNVSNEVKTMTRSSARYQEIYDAIVSKQHFNLMLNDRSIFQFSQKTQLQNCRLVFYPNPYQFAEYKSYHSEVISLYNEQSGFTQDEVEQLLAECDFTSEIPIIRYDLSMQQHCEMYHPAAHFHIGLHSENRWPVNRALTPFAFFLKILMHYYPDIWKKSADATNPTKNELDIHYRKELKENCPKISIYSPKHFSNLELERLHFS